MSLKDRTLFITGASRGIGKAIALAAARDGANIVVAAKTAEPHPRLPGTIFSAAEEIEAAGGKALPIVVDVRSEELVQAAIDQAVAHFGGLDILVNNASAIMLKGTAELPMKRFDLMHQVNTRGTYLCSRLALPHLKASDHAHILNISPPLVMEPRWFQHHVGYTMAKYGMSLCVLGMAPELKPHGVGVNALWPRTAVATAAVRNVLGGDAMVQISRTPEIMGDAAYAVLSRDPATCTGSFFIDDEVLAEEGETDFAKYQVDPSLHPSKLAPDFFLAAGDEPAVKYRS